MLTHLGLAQHLDAVLADELQQLTVGEAEELVLLGYLEDKAVERRQENIRDYTFCFFLITCLNSDDDDDLEKKTKHSY